MHYRIILCLIVAFCFNSLAFAQNDIDSLQSLIAKAPEHELVEIHLRIAERLALTDREAAIKNAKSANKLANDQNNKSGQIQALKRIASCYSILNKQDSTIFYLNQALLLLEEDDAQEKGEISIKLAEAIAFNGDLFQAIKILSNSLELYEHELEDMTLLTIYDRLVTFRAIIGQVEEAEDLSLEALRIAKERQVYNKMILFNQFLGKIEFDRFNYDLSREYYHKANALIGEFGVKQQRLSVQVALAKIEIQTGLFLTALQRIDSILMENDVHKRKELEILSIKSLALYKLNRFQEADSLIDRMYNDVLAIDYPHVLRDIYELKYKIAEVGENYIDAYQFLTKWAQVNDTIESRDSRAKVDMLTKEFDFKSLKAQSEADIQIAQVKLRNRNYLLISISCLSILLFILLNLNKRRLKVKLESSLLNEKLLEKEIEVSELKLLKNRDTIDDYEKKLDQNKFISGAKERLFQILQSPTIKPTDWISFKIAFDDVYPEFNTKLESYSLTFNDQRLSWLVSLQLSNKEIAQVLGITAKSVAKAKSRLSQRLDLKTPKDLDEKLKNL